MFGVEPDMVTSSTEMTGGGIRPDEPPGGVGQRWVDSKRKYRAIRQSRLFSKSNSQENHACSKNVTSQGLADLVIHIL